MRVCFRCGGEIPGDQRVLREEDCPACGQDLHCCRQCRFYEPSLSKQCAEPQAEPVRAKERSNFCDFFSIAEGRPGGSERQASPDAARDAWRRLFKDPS